MDNHPVRDKLQKKNVLMIIPNYGVGGAQRVFSQLVTGLHDQYNVIEVVFNNDDTDAFGGRGEKVSLNVPGGDNFLSKGFYFLLRCWRLRKLKAEYNCHICVSHLEGANFVNVLSGGLGRKILCVHGSKTANDSNRRGTIKFIENRILTPLLFNQADAIVAVSYGIAEELKRVFQISRSKLHVVQNGVDMDSIRTLSSEPISDVPEFFFRKKVLVYSGRLAPQKNPIPLIDIYHKISDHGDYHLLIVGDGPLKSEMQKKCRDLDLKYHDISTDGPISQSPPGILFMGFQKNPFKYLRKSSLFILLSNFEGFPLAPCEALACDLPIIATDCPTGVREVLSPGGDAEWRPIAVPEYSEYGVLMPLIRAGSEYESDITLWSDTLVKLFTNEALMKDYKVKASRRAAELSEVNFIKHWKNLLNLL